MAQRMYGAFIYHMFETSYPEALPSPLRQLQYALRQYLMKAGAGRIEHVLIGVTP